MSIEKQLADTVASLVLAQIKPHLNNNRILKESEVMEILGVSKPMYYANVSVPRLSRRTERNLWLLTSAPSRLVLLHG